MLKPLFKLGKNKHLYAHRLQAYQMYGKKYTKKDLCADIWTMTKTITL